MNNIFPISPFFVAKLLILSALLLVSPLQAATIQGKVVSVADGDTVTILDATHQQVKIRLAGIDAPEKRQPFGSRSKENLGRLVFGKNVTVDTTKQDKYGRTVGKILVNGVDANLEQVKSGLAWHYKKYESEQPQRDRAIYAQAEIDARSKKAGLWSDAAPVAPWDFRHGEGIKQNASDDCPCSVSICTGPKGGHFCFAPNGKKKYQ